MVTVTSATSTQPTVFPLIQCGSGTENTVTLGCLATGFMPSSLTYSWSSNGAALTDFIQYPPVLKDNLYTGVSQIQVSKKDWDARKPFLCDVTHETINSPVSFIKPQVIYELPTVKVQASSEEESEATFSCFAKDFSPKAYKIKWLKNDKDVSSKIDEIQTPVMEKTYENGKKLYSVASFLTVQRSEWIEKTKFTCLFEGKAASGATFVNSSVTCRTTGIRTQECREADADIQIIGPTMEDMFLKRRGKLVCQVKENHPSLGTIWWEDENGNDMYGSLTKELYSGKKIVSVSLDVTYEEWSQGIKRYCVVEHSQWLEPVKRSYERNFERQSQRPAVFMLSPVEHTRKDMVTLTCFVKGFFPQELLVSWLVDDEETDTKNYEFHTTNPIKNNGSYSAYGQLLISLEQWQKKDVGYSCVVHHESVENTTTPIVRSIGYRTFVNTNLVNLNLNIPEKCKPL